MARGSLVKGPNSFNCVGLAEKAYEYAGVNNGEGLTTWEQEEIGTAGLPPVLTPAEQYNATKPAVGIQSKIPIVSFTEWGENCQIVIMNEDGSGLEEITSGSSIKNYPRLSPNRDKIIFELYENDNSILYIMNLDGSGLTKLRSESTQPAWSSKDKIAFVPRYGFSTIYLFDISNPSVKEKLTGTSVVEKTPTFSPDGNYVMYTYNYRDIVITDINSKNSVVIIPGDSNVKNREPEFSPDGNKIVFRSNMYENDNFDIYVYDVNSKTIERLTYDSSFEYSPHFSENGSKIFFASDLDGTYQIYSVNSDGLNKKQLTYGPKNHDFGYY